VVDFRQSEHALGLARTALATRSSASDSSLFPVRIELATRPEDLAGREAVVVRVEYLQ
jgi:hypothetical protein